MSGSTRSDGYWCAGNQVALVRPWHRRGKNLPLPDGRQSNVGGNGLAEQFPRLVGAGQIRVAQRLLQFRASYFTGEYFQWLGVHLPLPTSELDKQFAGRGGSRPHRRHRRRGRAAAGRRPIVGHLGGVRHQHIDLVDRHAQFLRRGLGQLRTRPLPHFDFTRQDGNASVLAEVNPRRYVERPRSASSTAALGGNRLGADSNQQACAEYLNKLPAIQLKIELQPLDRFIAIGRQRLMYPVVLVHS